MFAIFLINFHRKGLIQTCQKSSYQEVQNLCTRIMMVSNTKIEATQRMHLFSTLTRRKFINTIDGTLENPGTIVQVAIPCVIS